MPHNRRSARKSLGAADVVADVDAAGEAGAAAAAAGPGAAVARVRPNCRTGSFYLVFTSSPTAPMMLYPHTALLGEEAKPPVFDLLGRRWRLCCVLANSVAQFQ